MLRFPRIVTAAAVGAALLMLGNLSGQAQVGPGVGPQVAPQVSPHGTTAPSVETYRQLEVLGKILDIVRSDYVDKTDDGKLITSAINGVLGSLAPHSSSMDPKSYRDMQATTSGQFGGLGMQV